MIKLILLICTDSTLTGIMAAKRFRTLRELLYPQYIKESAELLPLLSLCGKGGIKNMKMHIDYKVIQNENSQITALSAIPIHFKRQRSDIMIEILQSIMNNLIDSQNFSKDFNSCLQNSLEIIYELLFKSKHDQEINRSGECCKLFTDDYPYNITPLICMCSQCQIHFCIACCRYHSTQYKDHTLKYLLYPYNLKTTCECRSPHRAIFNPSALCEIKEYLDLNLFSSDGADNFMVYDTNDKPEKIEITSLNEITIYNDDINTNTIFYYEIEIKSAGWTENIVVGILGTDIEYHGNSGYIYKNGEHVQSGPRFGSKDTIGIGLTSSCVVYFTYNGFNIHIYIECIPVRAVRPSVKLKGKLIKVMFKFTNFLCDPRSYPSLTEAKILELIQNLENWIRIYLTNMSLFPKFKTNSAKIKSVLKDLRRQLPIEIPVFNQQTRGSTRRNSQESCKLF